MLNENFLLPWLQWSEPKNTDRLHDQTVLRGIIHKELQPLRKFCKLSIKELSKYTILEIIPDVTLLDIRM